MAIKDLDFHNYIYLFNDPNQVAFSFEGSLNPSAPSVLELVRDRAGIFFSEYNTANDEYPTVSSYLSDTVSNVDSNVFNDEEQNGDFPKFLPGQSLTDDLRREYRPPIPADEAPGLQDTSIYYNGQSISTNMAIHPTYLPYFRSVNDIGLSPFNRHNFYINGDVVKYRYANVNNTDEFAFNKRHTIFSLPIGAGTFGSAGIQDKLNSAGHKSGDTVHRVEILNNKEVPGTLYKQYVQSVGKDDYSLKSYDNPYGNNFTYTQDFWLTIRTTLDTDPTIQDDTSKASEDPQQAPDKIFTAVHNEEYVQSFFQNMVADDSALGGINSINSPRKLVLDAATKIGVPYDTHTVIKDKVDLQNYGVKNATPQYESFYNYFDFQYEPKVLRLVDENLLGENALPSVYDFLYLEKQFNTLSAFLYVNEDLPLEDLSLKNLDNYLEKISSLYSGYFETFGDDAAPASGEEKNIYDFEYPDIGNAGIPGAPATAIYNTPIAALFDTNKSKFLKRIATDNSFLEEVKISKTSFVPKWIEDVKRGIYFSEKSMQTFNQAEQFEDNFPFCMRIDIPTEGMGPIAKLLSEADLLDSINTHAASLTTPLDSNDEFGVLNSLEDFGYSTAETVGNFYGGMLNGHDNQLFNLFEEVKMKTFRMYFTNSPESSTTDDPFLYSQSPQSTGGNIALGLKPFLSPTDIFLDTFQEIGLESPKNVFTYSDNENKIASSFANILKQLQGKKFTESIKKLFIDGGALRTPSDIQEGKLAHQETLMYEIAKYDSNNNYIQSIFLPMSELDNINYLDTQVIPFKNYFYKIFAHKVIVGTKYRMAPFIQNQEGEYIEAVITDQNLYNHQYWVQPYLQFVRVPYYNAPMVNVSTDELNYSRIEDSPPLAPQVQFVPYKGIDNKLLLLFNGSTGEAVQRPIPIFDSDESLFADIVISQKSKGYKGGILFKGDDVLERVDIFRVENKLSEYKDAPNDSTFFLDYAESNESNSTSYVDTIQPNKDYYYFFRAADIHGKMSNPTRVYKVRMISDVNTAPYLKVELFNFEKPEKLMDSKTFQKYILLEANSTQNVVSYPDLTTDIDGGALGNAETQVVNLGKESNSIFGKKYKLRITSKQTGRKIDVNVTFKEPKNTINDI